MKNKILKFILIGVVLYIAVLIVEFCYLYAKYGNGVWDIIKEFFIWYEQFLFF